MQNENVNIHENIQPEFPELDKNDIDDEDIEIRNIPNQNDVDDNPEIDDSLDRQLKIQTILEYKKEFGVELQAFSDKFDPDYLNSLSSEELNDLTKKLEVCAGCTNSADMLKPVIMASIGALEGIGNKIGMKWQGLQTILANNKKFEKTLTLIKLKYGTQMYVDPIYQAGYTILSTALYLDTHNRAIEKKQEFSNIKVDNKLIDEFKDL